VPESWAPENPRIRQRRPDPEPYDRSIGLRTTITYNVTEAAIALTEGARVSSTALIGFGPDSVIEVSSAAAVAWQFAGRELGATSAVSDSKQTLLCIYLSAVLLVGLLLNSLFGWVVGRSARCPGHRRYRCP
jgi:hypothetical protein